MIKKALITFSFIFFVMVATAQDTLTVVEGVVMNAVNDQILENVNIVNLDKVVGTTSNEKGEFSIEASVGDKLFFTRLGFETLEINVTNDWF
ncbi:MAG TPA: carboxypeptidase-like regulatory domain-containing protein, partial [Flavobacteriaceae bacterium]|nr:carboxypeptidase-like regulatory domain-containing protein [Flavobacteriaceae bacterium]